MKQKYLIKLRPLDKYFFGGEKTFGQGDETNYLVKSNYFPQQTGLLGMLRYELLLQNDLLTPGSGSQLKPEAKSLIGKHGFRVNNDERNEFGAIDHISRLFILKDDGTRIAEAPLDLADQKKYKYYQLVFGELEAKAVTYKSDYQTVATVLPPLVYQLMANGERRTNDDGDELLYDPKDGINHRFMDDNEKVYRFEPAKDHLDKLIFEKNKKEFKEYLFIPDGQVGIYKNSTEEGFYKQTYYRMRKGFSMAFYAEIDLPEGISFESNTIFMGGEKSAFEMTVEPVNEVVFPKVYSKPFCLKDSSGDNIQKMILLSDTYVDVSIYENCEFAISETVDFRFFKTSVIETSNYNDLYTGDKPSKTKAENEAAKKSKPNKSQKFNLLRKGSILYVKEVNLASVEAILKQAKDFRQIGYNAYKVIK